MRNIFKRTIPPISPLEHPRIKDRTFKQQEYRDKLANNLKADRALGEVGKLLAEDRLKKEQKSEEYIVAKYGFTKQWARELIKAGEWWTVARNLEKFEGLDKEIAKLLIEAGKWKVVIEYIKHFEGLDNEIAKLLIEAKKWWWWYVVKYIKHFEWVDHNEIAKLLIKIGRWRIVAENIKKFKWLDAEIAKILIKKERWRDGGSRVARYIKYFEWDDDYIELSVAANIKSFEWVYHNEIAKMLIEAGRWWTVARNLEKFEWVDHNEIAKLLIELGYADEIRRSIKSSEQSEV